MEVARSSLANSVGSCIAALVVSIQHIYSKLGNYSCNNSVVIGCLLYSTDE